MSLRHFAIHRPSPTDDFLEILGPGGIRVLLKIIRDAYISLYQQNSITLVMNENEITEKLFLLVLQRWRDNRRIPSSISPIHEKQDRSNADKCGRPPTIDFCFEGDWDTQAYFGAECKLIEANNKTLCNKYVNQGVDRYLSGKKYNPRCPEGAMVGYIRQTKCTDVAQEIHVRLQSLAGTPTLNKTDWLLPFEEHYFSNHQRQPDNSPFTIHHLLFHFSPLL